MPHDRTPKPFTASRPAPALRLAPAAPEDRALAPHDAWNAAPAAPEDRALAPRPAGEPLLGASLSWPSVLVGAAVGAAGVLAVRYLLRSRGRRRRVTGR